MTAPKHPCSRSSIPSPITALRFKRFSSRSTPSPTSMPASNRSMPRSNAIAAPMTPSVATNSWRPACLNAKQTPNRPTRAWPKPQQMLAKQEAGYAEISGRFDEDAYHKLVAEDEDVRRHLGAIDGQLSEQRRRLDAEQAEIVQLREREDELSAAQTQHAFLQEQHELLSLLRTILREAGPYVTAALVKQISYEAAQIFGEIMQDFTRRLHWDEEYAVTLEVDGYKRQFAQLSGGEQMSAALSVRLALLREMSDINVAFFDEPTTNLDETRRDSLAQQILAIKGFRQLFVISHDDTFEQATENLVRVHKVDGLSVVEATA
ncbi:MAG: SMC family ATPase [Caldilineaceae bacterium]